MVGRDHLAAMMDVAVQDVVDFDACNLVFQSRTR
jgi:hypothetical protein